MKASKLLVVLGLALGAAAHAHAQRETYDLATFTAPAGWKREVKERVSTCFTTTNARRGTYCRIFVYLSAKGSGNVVDDFASEWKTLIVANFAVKAPPSPIEGAVAEGWTSRAGSGTFEFNGGTSSVLLCTWSGHGRMMSVVALTDDAEYMPAMTKFLESVELGTPGAGSARTVTPAATAPAPPVAGRYQFTTTTFDDGWVATEQPDWVQARKGDAVARIHYTPPDKPGFANLDETTRYFWDKLVAPRYRSVKNLWVRRSFWSDGDWMNQIYFASADAEAAGTGNRVHVVLFKKGNAGRWLEIAVPDKGAFERQFGVVHAQDGTDWERMAALAGCNTFAVAAGDLVGTWKSSSGAGIEYYSVYDGTSLGMATSSSTDEFVFAADGTYRSVSKIVMGTGANLKYGSEACAGTYRATDWGLTLTGRFKGATETYRVAFEAVKGGRILHMVRDATVDYHLFRVR